MIGFGTEKIEDELSILFPDKVIQRLDLDATRSKNAYQQIKMRLRAFFLYVEGFMLKETFYQARY
jgi:primosomal protein N'